MHAEPTEEGSAVLSITMPQSVNATTAPLGAPVMSYPSAFAVLLRIQAPHAGTVVRSRKADGNGNRWPLSPEDGPSG